jgi:tRNA uridine 5-carboxymethylaminomethyl modification enzyme
LVTEERYRRFIDKKNAIEKEAERLKNKRITLTDDVRQFLEKYGSSDIKNGVTLYEMLKRPEISYEAFRQIDDEMPVLSREISEEIEIQIKYEGYIKKQLGQAEQFKKLENKKLPRNINYKEIRGLSLESQEKLSDIRPDNLGQASRISGVSPADISVLMVYIEQLRRTRRSE